MREHLPDDRVSVTHRFSILSMVEYGETRTDTYYVTVGLYPDGRPGEVFITMKQRRDSSSAMLDAMAIAFSVALQHGAPHDSVCRKFIGQKFEPAGATNNERIPRTTSPVDYLGRWMLDRFGVTE